MGSYTFPVILGKGRSDLGFVLQNPNLRGASARVLAAYDAGQNSDGDIDMRRLPDGSWALALLEIGSNHQHTAELQTRIQRDRPDVRVVTAEEFLEDPAWKS